MRSYIFPSIVMVTALSLAFGAALFTVLGFRELFEATLKITYMAATIELGKIVAVSALYQFRNILGWFWKSFLFILVLVAMAVTSMGVYGYLASSFQKDSLGITQNTSRLELLDSRKAALEARLEGMDAQIAEVPETYVTKRMELIATFGPERTIVLAEIDKLDDRKLELTLEKIEAETEFGAVIILARSVDWLDETQAMLYFIMAVIFIFDPLAIALTYSANVGFASAATNKANAKRVPSDTASGSESDSDMLGEIGDMLEGAIKPVAESVSKVSDEVENLKNRKVSNPRAEVIDSMRSKDT